jgi:hypothetical protein
MKYTLLIITALMLVVGCSDDDDSHDVMVEIGRYNTIIWSFGIFVNGNEIFDGTECGSNSPYFETCLDFTDPFPGGNAFVYEFTAKKGDKIGVLLNAMDACYSFSKISIYSDNDLKESEMDECDDCECGLISADYTL